jgi:hypothetical protein
MHDNRIGGEVVSVLASSVVDRGFEYRGRVIPKTIFFPDFSMSSQNVQYGKNVTLFF